MIRVNRGAEPPVLAATRAAELDGLRLLGRPPTSSEIRNYRVVAEELWSAQRRKCCYCELKVPKSFNDVEHYRPKASADRRPGCAKRHGYWWLAFNWDNLLYACPSCNRTEKNDLFPVDAGSVTLEPENIPPGLERPLLIDPGGTINPVEHIIFVQEAVDSIGGPKYWWARPRHGSALGTFSIFVLGLNRLELRELRNDYFETTIAPEVAAIQGALARADRTAILREFKRALGLLDSRNPFVALSFDALRSLVPNSVLRRSIRNGWPLPRDVAA